MNGLDGAALDRYITGNYGEDQLKEEWECPGHDLKLVGYEPAESGDDQNTRPVYACRNCGDLFDSLYCQKPMRDGPCALHMGHRGRHTTVAFYCDSCGKMRPGQPVAQAVDTDGVVDVVLCFICTKP